LYWGTPAIFHIVANGKKVYNRYRHTAFSSQSYHGHSAGFFSMERFNIVQNTTGFPGKEDMDTANCYYIIVSGFIGLNIFFKK
jgi:hypothetical protein